jgi:starch synthase
MKKRVLFVSQEINPFLPETEISKTSRSLPQLTQESGKEIRIFMPRYGIVNERRHQLHEVIRLSGMNLVVDDHDHPLIIKVASIPQARMQVYFIDNDEYFRRKSFLTDSKGKLHPDSDERAIFFAKGVLETVKKLGWKPDIIHCHGWMASLLPLYLKKLHVDDPHFTDSKVVVSIYNQGFGGTLNKKLLSKLEFDGIENKDVDVVADPSYSHLMCLAAKNADGIVRIGDELDAELVQCIDKSGVPVLENPGDGDVAAGYNAFYDKLLEENSVTTN